MLPPSKTAAKERPPGLSDRTARWGGGGALTSERGRDDGRAEFDDVLASCLVILQERQEGQPCGVKEGKSPTTWQAVL